MKVVGGLGEFGLIERLSKLAPGASELVKGIGDDCAVIRVNDTLLLATCDVMIEDRHFRRTTLSPQDIGWRAATAGVSDIAAMGGSPLFCLVTLACGAEEEIAFVEDVYRGIGQLLAEYGIALAGGDTARTSGPFTLDITTVGQVSGERCLFRDGARPGDMLAVTGPPGLSAAGLHALENGHEAPALIAAHARPRPRMAEGQWLCDSPAVHAMIDVSDGLAQDSGRIAEESGLGVDIEPERLRPSPALQNYCREHGLDASALMLCGGEDYELAFAIEADAAEGVVTSLNERFGLEAAILGRFTDAWRGVRVGGETFSESGFDHFR